MTNPDPNFDLRQEWDSHLLEFEQCNTDTEELVRREAGSFLEWKEDAYGQEHHQNRHDSTTDASVEWIRGAIKGITPIREIGRGGMGVVYEAIETSTGRHVALKLLHPEHAGLAASRRIMRESSALALLDHPGITRLLRVGAFGPESGELAGRPYLVLEHVNGLGLQDYLDRENPSLRDRVRLIADVAGAVAHAHQRGVLHLDLKPSNVMIRKDHTIKVLDFGIARILDEHARDSTVTYLTHPFGTITCMSPEQANGRAAGAGSDVYALGAMLHRTLTGNHPVHVEGIPLSEAARRLREEPPTRPRTVDQRIPRDIETIILTALSKAPRDRYPTAAEFEADLRRWLEQRPILARRIGPVGHTIRFCRRRPRLASGLILTTAAITIIASVATWQAARATHAEARAVERFNDVRTLANTVIYELHDAIEDLPGSTLARETLIDRALQYLTVLSSDPTADASLRLELADAYLKISNVQGDQRSSNLGNVADAMDSLDNAINLLGTLEQERHNDPEFLITLAKATTTNAILLDTWTWTAIEFKEEEQSKYESVIAEYAKAETLINRALQVSPSNQEALRVRAELFMRRGIAMHSRNDTDQSIRELTSAVDQYDSLSQLSPDNFSHAYDRAYATHILGYIKQLHHLDNASDALHEALVQLRRLVSDRPWSVRAHSTLASTLFMIASEETNTGRYSQALAFAHEALSITRANVNTDPNSALWFRQLSVNTARLADIRSHAAANTDLPHAERLKHAREAVEIKQRALEMTLERASRNWLPEWESHYPDMLRNELDDAEQALVGLENEADHRNHQPPPSSTPRPIGQ